MSIGATKAKGAHTCTARGIRRRIPGPFLAANVKWRILEIKESILFGHIQTGRQGSMPHGQENLLHTGNPRRSGRVPNVALHRPQSAVILLGSLFAEYRRQRFELEGIA